MSIRDDIIQALYDTAEYSRPKLIRLGVQAMRELIHKATREDMQMSCSAFERSQFHGVPFKQYSPLAMDPNSWQVDHDGCLVCDRRGYQIVPIMAAPCHETMVIEPGVNPFRGPPCTHCKGEELEPIKGSIACD